MTRPSRISLPINFSGQFDRNGEAETFRHFVIGDFVEGQGIDADQFAH